MENAAKHFWRVVLLQGIAHSEEWISAAVPRDPHRAPLLYRAKVWHYRQRWGWAFRPVKNKPKAKTKQQQNEKKPCKSASLFSITCAGESSWPFCFPNAKSQALLLTSSIQTGHHCQPELGQHRGKKPTSIYFHSWDMPPFNPMAEAAPGQLKSATSMSQRGCKVKLRSACTAQTARWEWEWRMSSKAVGETTHLGKSHTRSFNAGAVEHGARRSWTE